MANWQRGTSSNSLFLSSTFLFLYPTNEEWNRLEDVNNSHGPRKCKFKWVAVPLVLLQIRGKLLTFNLPTPYKTLLREAILMLISLCCNRICNFWCNKSILIYSRTLTMTAGKNCWWLQTMETVKCFGIWRTTSRNVLSFVALKQSR